MDVGWPQIIVTLVALQRVWELARSRRNTARLRSLGAIEYGARHYPFIVLLHGSWLAAIFLAASADSHIALVWLSAFIVLQAARIWVLISLGNRWSTRVLVKPRAALVASGPYRWLRHPNYVIVIAEFAVLPMVFGEVELALTFSLLNALLIAHRIRVEDSALAVVDGPAGSKRSGR
jgi:methyltransferase